MKCIKGKYDSNYEYFSVCNIKIVKFYFPQTHQIISVVKWNFREIWTKNPIIKIVSNEILFSQVFSENIWQLNFVEVSQSENFQVTHCDFNNNIWRTFLDKI